jgi:single-strand DNA-binding protein
MASVNRVQILGHLGHDPDLRFTPDEGTSVTELSVATTEVWKDRATGVRQEHTEWHRIIMFGRLAEVARDYLRKGRTVYVDGRLRTRKWTDKEGNNRYITEIIADSVQMIGGNGDIRRSNAETDALASARRAAPAAANSGRVESGRSAHGTQATLAGVADDTDDTSF